MAIVLRIRKLRKVNGWSQAELARRSGVNQAIISRLESGEVQSINFPNLEKLARAFMCDPGYLILRRRD
ncbi:MAG: helix-turn-helix domain-containing protein [Gemmatimonadales bacterium]